MQKGFCIQHIMTPNQLFSTAASRADQSAPHITDNVILTVNFKLTTPNRIPIKNLRNVDPFQLWQSDNKIKQAYSCGSASTPRANQLRVNWKRPM